jgi:hypothetical protein
MTEIIVCIDMSAIEYGVTELYKKIKAWKKKNIAQAKDEDKDEKMVDTMEEKQEKQHTQFEIAIVGGRKKDVDEDEDMT